VKEVKEFKKCLKLSSVIGAFQSASSGGVVWLSNNLSIAVRPAVRGQLLLGDMPDCVAPTRWVGRPNRSIILAGSIRIGLEERGRGRRAERGRGGSSTMC